MARSRLDDSITRDNVLRRMVPGQSYTPYALAAKFHVPTAQIRPVLEGLVNDGALELQRTSVRQTWFVRPKGSCIEPPQAAVELSIATAPVHVRLDGELTIDPLMRVALERCKGAKLR